MSTQITSSVTSPTIAAIYQQIKSDNLNLQPDFQRKFVWTIHHIEQFIETILLGYPFPEIYTCVNDTDLTTITTKHSVIDGQQRLTSIIKYITGDLDSSKLTQIKPYSDLSQEEQKKFLNYQLVVRDLGAISEETIREVFRRINLTKFKLEDVEIHNAIYDGCFIQLAKKLSEQIDLRSYDVLFETDFTRMGDVYFFLSILATLEKNYFAGNKEIEKTIIEFNEIFPNNFKWETQLKECFNIIQKLNLEKDSIWFRKSNFFTLVIEIALNIEEAKKIKLDSLKNNLNNLEDNVLKNKDNKNNKYGKYYNYMYSGTNNRTARIYRAELFRKEGLQIK